MRPKGIRREEFQAEATLTYAKATSHTLCGCWEVRQKQESDISQLNLEEAGCLFWAWEPALKDPTLNRLILVYGGHQIDALR